MVSLFVSLHLLNAASAAAGPTAYALLQRALRVMYQFPLVELGLVLGLGLHVVAGIALMRQRRAPLMTTGTTSPLLRAHRIAGRFLALVIIGHVIATRGPSLIWGVPLEFDGVALSMLVMPLVYVPYYMALGIAGVVHGVIGVAMSFPGLVRHPALRPVIVVIGGAVIAGVLGFAGVLVDIDERAIWQSNIARHLVEAGIVTAPSP